MLYLCAILLIFIFNVSVLNASVLQEFKHNFYIGLEKSYVNDAIISSQDTFTETNNNYSFGYLSQKDNFYFGIAFKEFSKNIIQYTVSTNNKDIDIETNRDSAWLLLFKYNVLEFESIKLLFGVDLGYQINNINLHYKVGEIKFIKEIRSSEIAKGEVITDNIKKQCDAGFTGGNIGNNIVYNNNLEKYVVVGTGVFCNYSHYEEKEVVSDKSKNLIQSSFPISFNFTLLNEINKNIDVGINLSLTTVEKLNIYYSDKFIAISSQNMVSAYNLAFIINFKTS